MLHSNHFTLAALVGLAAITATLSSCTKSMEEPKTGTTSRISLNVQTFDIGQSDFPASGTKADASDPFKRLAFKVFDSNGTAVFDTTQIYTSEGFGTIDFQLPDGTYTFVAVGHNVSSDNASDPTIVASIASTTLATLPEQNVVDVFCATKQVTIEPAVDLTETMTLPRANSKFNLVMTDAIPTGAAEMEFVLNTEGTESTTTPTLSPATGYATTDRQYVRTFDITKAVGKKGQSIGMNLLLIAATQDIDIMATAYDSDGDVIIARTLEAIPMKQNRITTATGVFFNSEATATFSINTTWDTEQHVTY